MDIPIHQVDAFADALFQGNPAAVCPLTEWIPDTLLQSIAAENNLSETAFYVRKSDGWQIRWFTPTTEVDLCGHATLAAAHVLFGLSDAQSSHVTFESRSGPLNVFRDGDVLTLDFPAQPAIPSEIPDQLVDALGVRPIELYRAADFMAVFKREKDIADISPDFRRLAMLDTRGVIITAQGDDFDFVSRFFAPRYGIDEDPVTGSAHCTLAPYWAKRLGRSDLTARQLSRRSGTLRCSVVADRVRISGRAVTYMTGTIVI